MQKVALITGSGRRIGATIAKYLHNHGFDIIIHCNKSQESANKLSTTLNSQRANSSQVLVASLNSEEEIRDLVNDSFAWRKRLDVVVNNASVFLKDNEAGGFTKMLTVNLKAPYWLNTYAYAYLQKVKGSIVNITDTHAKKPLKGYSVYCQTKAALSMQTKSLALEFAPDVRVNAVAPGAILWPEGINTLSNLEKQTIISKTPLKMHGDPIYIAKAVYSLIDNEFITGHEIVVDGGRNI